MKVEPIEVSKFPLVAHKSTANIFLQIKRLECPCFDSRTTYTSHSKTILSSPGEHLPATTEDLIAKKDSWLLSTRAISLKNSPARRSNLACSSSSVVAAAAATCWKECGKEKMASGHPFRRIISANIPTTMIALLTAYTQWLSGQIERECLQSCLSSRAGYLWQAQNLPQFKTLHTDQVLARRRVFASLKMLPCLLVSDWWW